MVFINGFIKALCHGNVENGMSPEKIPLLVYGISLKYGTPCALCEEIMKFGTDDL